MKNFNKVTKMYQTYCPFCDEELYFQVPDSVVSPEIKNYPVTFRYIHGEPPHSITLYIDANFNIRGQEFGDQVKLSEDLFDRLQQNQAFCADTEGELFLKTILNVFFNLLNDEVKEAPQILKRLGEKVCSLIEPLFLANNFDGILQEIKEFWQKIGFGKIRLYNVSLGDIEAIIEIDNCFECHFMEHATDPVCKMFEGFFERILSLKLGHYSVIETKCHAKGDKYCQFEIKTKK